MIPIQVADVLAAVVISTVGNGLLGRHLLQRYEAKHQTTLTRLKSELEGEIRTLQTSLDRTVFIHRTQFETEFTALRDIWAKVASVRAKMGTVRPLMDVIPQNETQDQRDEREYQRFKAFHDAFIDLLNAVDGQSPFIPEDIYRKLEEVIQVARGEALEVQVERGDRDRQVIRDWYQRGRENFQQLCGRATEVSDLIRARLAKLTVVPSDPV